MADPRLFDFDIIGVRHRYVDIAQRYALTPLTGAIRKDTLDRDAAITRSTEKLIEQWRARVDALRAHGWQRPIGKSLIYMLNCPPVGVVTNRKSKPCNQYAICPFCWSREYVKETYERLEYAYYSRDPNRPLRLDLVEIVTTEFLPMDEWPLSRLFQWIQVERRASAH